MDIFFSVHGPARFYKLWTAEGVQDIGSFVVFHHIYNTNNMFTYEMHKK